MSRNSMLPEHFTEYGLDGVMSNFDHSIDAEVAEHIKGKLLFSRYAGWNFNGKVWWDGSWKCDVWVHGSCVESIKADTLTEIMQEVCSKYGDD